MSLLGAMRGYGLFLERRGGSSMYDPRGSRQFVLAESITARAGLGISGLICFESASHSYNAPSEIYNISFWYKTAPSLPPPSDPS